MYHACVVFKNGEVFYDGIGVNDFENDGLDQYSVRPALVISLKS